MTKVQHDTIENPDHPPKAWYACEADGCSEERTHEAQELRWYSGGPEAEAGWYCEGCSDGMDITPEGPDARSWFEAQNTGNQPA